MKSDLEWYDEFAEREGGYRRTWRSELVGESGEAAFETLLLRLLRPGMRVLDAGCGSGEFTLRIARLVESIVGFDYSSGMIAAAQKNLDIGGIVNADFVLAGSRELVFEPAGFDVVYSRRGPASILLRPELLRPDGWMIGIHSARRDVIERRLLDGGFTDVVLSDYVAVERFPSLEDFARFWSRMPGHPNYLDEGFSGELEELAAEHRDAAGLRVEEYRVVWRGRRP